MSAMDREVIEILEDIQGADQYSPYELQEYILENHDYITMFYDYSMPGLFNTIQDWLEQRS